MEGLYHDLWIHNNSLTYVAGLSVEREHHAVIGEAPLVFAGSTERQRKKRESPQLAAADRAARYSLQGMWRWVRPLTCCPSVASLGRCCSGWVTCSLVVWRRCAHPPLPLQAVLQSCLRLFASCCIWSVALSSRNWRVSRRWAGLPLRDRPDCSLGNSQ